MNKKPSVLVIGGGLAGLAALKELVKHKGFTVQLLEASSELGGRAKSLILPDGTSFPAGAAFFNGQEGNLLWQYATDKGLISSRTKRPDLQSLHLFPNGEVISDKLISRLKSELQRFMFENKEKMDKATLSYGEFAIAKFKHSLVKENIPQDFDAILHGMLAYDGVQEGSKNVMDVNHQSCYDWVWVHEIKEVEYWNNAYSKIIKSLSESVPSALFQMNKKVVSVKWNHDHDNSAVLVKCSDGSCYEADHVIITVSLGVLKASRELFQPCLPSSKCEAIASVGFGLVNKVILQFQNPLFRTEYTEMRIYWKASDDKSLLVQTSPWIKGLHLIQYHSSPLTSLYNYSAWFVGEDAKVIQELPDHAIVKVILDALSYFLNKSIPTLMGMRTTKWNDSLYQGSYSYNSIGSGKREREELIKPVNGSKPLQLLFAGEATHCSWYSTTTAAYESGLREAKRLIDYYDHEKTSM